MHYYKRNLGDYSKKAGRLTMLEHGAYNCLLDACYDRERFPTEAEAIDWVWARTPEEVEAVKFVLSKFFELRDGVYVQNRVEEELNAYRAKSKKNTEIAHEREANRKAAAPQQHDSLSEQHETSPDEHARSPNHKPRTINQEPNKQLRARGARLAPDWVLPKAWGEWALQEQRSWDADYCRRVGEKFKDHWLAAPGARGVKLDWEATWRNWVRNEGPMRADQKPKLTLTELYDAEQKNAA